MLLVGHALNVKLNIFRNASLLSSEIQMRRATPIPFLSDQYEASSLSLARKLKTEETSLSLHEG